MPLYQLHIEGSTSADFSSGNQAIIVDVLGASTFKAPIGEPRVYWGRRKVNDTNWVRKIIVQCYQHSVTASTVDYGDLMSLEDVLYMPFLRLRRTSTNLPRTATTGGVDHNFWTHSTLGLLSNEDGTENPLQVVRTSGPDVSADFTTGTDKVTFELEAVLPNT